MSKLMKASLISILCLFLYGLPSAASVNLTLGTDDFYLSVGNYDYLPYGYAATGSPPPRISFFGVLSDYGTWVQVAPFGNVWQPFAAPGWRPYVYGHWVYTQYGPTWQGYEPWAWLGYHYGNWIWTAEFGWVWIPGYEWHPGRVCWVEAADTVGWMPLPPPGYDYSRGYLAQAGPYNQFSYQDDDFGNDASGSYRYGGPYYDPGYGAGFYNRDYDSISVNLWVFINRTHFSDDNYSDSYLDRGYTRDIFQRRLVRITSRPVDRDVMERVTGQPIREVPVQVKEIQSDRQPLKVVVPVGEEDKIRANANRVVREVIAPGFARNERSFKGQESPNQKIVSRLFRQEDAHPRLETVTPDTIIRNAEAARTDRDQHRQMITEREKQKVIEAEKEGKVKGPKESKPDRDPASRDDRIPPEDRKENNPSSKSSESAADRADHQRELDAQAQQEKIQEVPDDQKNPKQPQAGQDKDNRQKQKSKKAPEKGKSDKKHDRKDQQTQDSDEPNLRV